MPPLYCYAQNIKNGEYVNWFLYFIKQCTEMFQLATETQKAQRSIAATK